MLPDKALKPLQKGHFVPKNPIGNILDSLPLPLIFYLAMDSVNEKMNPTEEQSNGFDINTDENINGSQKLDDQLGDDSELEQLKAQVDELNDKYLRQVAEFDNFRRRSAKERMELIQTAGREVIIDLLDVLDDSERAQKQLESTDDVQQIKEGVGLVFSKLRSTLTAKGLKPIEALNQPFNVDLHEAITEIDGGEDMKGKVVAEVQKGYYLNDKIIRFAKVVVGK
jgi:molecular chaperone GrpE